MSSVTFITGNQKKAEYLEKYLGVPVAHKKINLDELQSLELREIVEHKARQAFSRIKSPILVEDSALEFCALGKLPGTFIKFFQQEISFIDICSLLNGKDRSAIAKCGFGYFDGISYEYFEGALGGSIAQTPRGSGDFGWDPIFIPEGYSQTRAELNDIDYEKTYLQIKPIDAVRRFLLGLK